MIFIGSKCRLDAEKSRYYLLKSGKAESNKFYNVRASDMNQLNSIHGIHTHAIPTTPIASILL